MTSVLERSYINKRTINIIIIIKDSGTKSVILLKYKVCMRRINDAVDEVYILC